MIPMIANYANRQDDYAVPNIGDELEEIAREYLDEQGGNTLGDIDTPAFVRRLQNVALMPPQGFSHKSPVLPPDEKIAALVSALDGVTFAPAG